jgi:protoporphyrinogen oxidase
MEKKKVIILGGGLSGLAAADILANNFEVVVLEKQKQLGGLAASFTVLDRSIPKYYHHVVSHNSTTKMYLERFGLLEGCKNWQRIKVAIASQGKLSVINNPFGLLASNLLSFSGKIRFGLFGLRTLFAMNPKNIPDSMNAKDWLIKMAGKEATQNIFEPLYAVNKFNIPLTEISAKQFANRLKEREIYDKFSYPEKGLQGLVDGLEQSIKSKGGTIITNCELQKVDATEKSVVCNGKKISGGAILNTIPIPEFLNVATGLPSEYSAQLAKLRYCPCVGVAFGTENFLKQGLYWINLFGERIHMIMQHSVLCDSYPYKVNWCLRYGGSEADFNLTDAEIKKEYLAVVKKYFPDSKIVWQGVFREKYAEPIYDSSYASYKPEFTTPIEGLFMAGIQVTFPKIRNMNSALESGETAAKLIQSRFGY